MHRNKLIGDLEAYRVRNPGEAATADRFLDFVRSHKRCFHRDCLPGHVTASAWLIDPGGSRALLTHHRKLNRWLQPGGHCDGDSDTLRAAVREAAEESGLEVETCSEVPLDIDIHAIPARKAGPGRKAEPAHFHYDVRYALRAGSDDFTVGEESHALAWVSFADLTDYTREPSILRMLAKWRGFRAT
ncbi:MAG: NUDIX hydrolase [Gammaproteobacteria bacterium]|nr:NUDIX hydrolase [Gammaproteobacteria bacterium]